MQTAKAIRISAELRRARTNKDRFERFIVRADGCWEWRGHVAPHGYGSFTWKNEGKLRFIGAHRASYMLFKGPIPEGKLVRHTCDNRACVNPAHLKLGTQVDNMNDCKERRRTAKGERVYGARLTADQVRELRRRYAEGEKQVDLAAAFGIIQPTVSQIVRRKTWQHV